jgi:peptidoglycan/LPS O-acetylase OafA/YrhL
MTPAKPKESIAAHPYRFFGSYRLMLAVMVLLSHSPGFLPTWLSELSLGNVGVFGFFVLSGFVIAEALDVFYRGNVRGFFLNRFLKIYPTFWAATLFAYVVMVSLGRSDFPPDPVMVVVNFTIIFGHLPFGSSLVLLTLAWAVIVELIFYALIGIVSAIGWRAGRTEAVLGISAILTLGVYIYVDQTESFTRSFSVFRYTPFFVAGVAYYYLLSRRSAVAAGFLMVAFAASIHSYWVYHQPVAEHLRLGTLALFVLINCLFAWVAILQCPARVERVDKRMGDVTYGVYLGHMPVIWAVAVLTLRPPLESLLVVVCSFTIAWLVFVSVEKPIFKVRDKIRGLRLYD